MASGSGVGALAGGGAGSGVISFEAAFDISSSDSSSIILRSVASRSDLEGPNVFLIFEGAIVESMKSSSCSDSEASFMGSRNVSFDF